MSNTEVKLQREGINWEIYIQLYIKKITLYTRNTTQHSNDLIESKKEWIYIHL